MGDPTNSGLSFIWPNLFDAANRASLSRPSCCKRLGNGVDPPADEGGGLVVIGELSAVGHIVQRLIGPQGAGLA